MNKRIIIVLSIVAAAAVIIAGIYLAMKPKTQAANNNQPAAANGTENIPGEIAEPEIRSEFTLADVALHASKENCWMAIAGKVYDPTAFIALGQHPPQITLGCGKDATTLFQNRTAADGKAVGSGQPHSSEAAELLAKYYIGTLVQ